MYELIGQMLGVAPEQLKAVAETITIIAGAILAVTGGRALSGIVKRIVDTLCEMLERVSATLERMETTMGQLSGRYQDVKDALEKHDRRVDTVNAHTDEAVKPAVDLLKLMEQEQAAIKDTLAQHLPELAHNDEAIQLQIASVMAQVGQLVEAFGRLRADIEAGREPCPAAAET